MDPNTLRPPPQSFEERISQVRLWTLIPVVFGPLIAWFYLGDHLGVSEETSRHVTEAIVPIGLFGWWLSSGAPRPVSVRSMLGRPLDLGGWGLVTLALLGGSCVQIIWWLARYCRDMPRVASNGGAYSFLLSGPDPKDFLWVLSAVVLAPLIEELVFRGTLFRKWRVRWGASKAVLLSSVIFGVLHPQHVTAFLAGLTYALVYTRVRSLWAAVVLHALSNGMLLVLGGLHYFWDLPRLRLDSPWKYGLFALVLLVGTGVWLQFVRKSWRTLRDPLPPDSLQAAPAASSSNLTEPVRVAG